MASMDEAKFPNHCIRQEERIAIGQTQATIEIVQHVRQRKPTLNDRIKRRGCSPDKINAGSFSDNGPERQADGLLPSISGEHTRLECGGRRPAGRRPPSRCVRRDAPAGTRRGMEIYLFGRRNRGATPKCGRGCLQGSSFCLSERPAG
jgi:hypothetical protein